MKVWAVTEDRTVTGAVLLLPHPPTERFPVKIKTWGSLEAQLGTIIHSEPVDLPPAVLYRVGVLFEGGAVERKDQTAAAASVTAS